MKKLEFVSWGFTGTATVTSRRAEYVSSSCTTPLTGDNVGLTVKTNKQKMRMQ